MLAMIWASQPRSASSTARPIRVVLLCVLLCPWVVCLGLLSVGFTKHSAEPPQATVQQLALLGLVTHSGQPCSVKLSRPTAWSAVWGVWVVRGTGMQGRYSAPGMASPLCSWVAACVPQQVWPPPLLRTRAGAGRSSGALWLTAVAGLQQDRTGGGSPAQLLLLLLQQICCSILPCW